MLEHRLGLILPELSSAKMLQREIAQNAFAHSHAGHQQCRELEPVAQGSKDDGGDSHHLCPVPSHSERLHPAGHIQAQDCPEPLSQEFQVQGILSAHAWRGGEARQSLGIAAASHGQRGGEMRRVRPNRAQHREDVVLQHFHPVFGDGTADPKGFHQAHRPDRQGQAALNVVAAHEADFQTSSAEIQNKLRRHSFRKRAQHGGTHQASFLGGANDLESNTGLAIDAPDQRVPVDRLANSAGGHGAVFPDVVAIEQAAKMTKSLGATRQG